MSEIEINKGECVHAEMTWEDEEGPIDLTGRTLAIVEAYPAALTGGTVTATDAVAGKADIHIPAALTAQMGEGRVNWIRLGMQLPNGCMDTSNKLWITVA